MHAVILAGGKGTRLRPYTTCVPKPLVPIGDTYSILEIVLHQLGASGFTRVTLAVGHMGHLIRAFVGDGSRYGLDVDYTDEETPLGTIGPVLNVLDRLPVFRVVGSQAEANAQPAAHGTNRVPIEMVELSQGRSAGEFAQVWEEAVASGMTR